ncbi:MAG TPA: AI-2E family transporter [Gemmatimonadaceae bacterium]
MTTTAKWRAAALVATLGVAIAIALAPFALGLLGAAVLYVIFTPLHQRIARMVGPSWAATIVLIAAIALLLLPAVALLGLLVDEAPVALRALQQSVLLERLAELRVGQLQVGAELAKASGSVLSWISRHALSLVGSATHTTLNLVIAFFGLYYLLVSADGTWHRLRRLIPFSAESAEALRERFHSVTRATLLGMVLASVLQGSIVGTGFWLVGLPSPVFWGVVTAFASLLPVLGSAFVWIPGTLVLVVEGRYGAAVALLAIGGVVASNIDNVIRPIVYRRVSNIHPMITLVGAFAGLRYFGLLGALLGPLAIVYFVELWRMYEMEYGAEPPPPVKSAATPPAAPRQPASDATVP